jgi:hypothetical protein
VADAIAQYTFLPWYRTGLGSAVSGSDAARATVDVTVHARFGAASEDYTQKVHLIGPGDILGIDTRAVVRLEPRPYANDFEANYLAAIEFFDEDYPWRYSPSVVSPAGKGRLDPWLALIVLDETEFEWEDPQPGMPRSILIRDTSVLPPPEDLWAWAHSHLNMLNVGAAPPQEIADQLAANPVASCSRILSPRHLAPLKTYHAFLVPAFESGRRAGLVSPDAVDRTFAWTRPASARLPVYIEWSFRTAEEGDFKELAQRLQPRASDPAVGHRPMDVSRPLENAAAPPIRNILDPPRAVLDLEGALKTPNAQSTPWTDPNKAAFQSWLAGFINLGEAWQLNLPGPVDGELPLPNGIKLPVVLPPSYGRWHADTPLLDPAQASARWLEQINLDPRNRVAAAFGTLVSQRNQEAFMARAWAQFGQLFQANRFRFRAQFFREVLTAVAGKHFDPLPAARKLAITAPAHARIRIAPEAPATVWGQMEKSALPVAVVAPAMRRVLRDGAPLARRFGTATPHLANMISDLASARVAVSPVWNQPAARVSLANPPAAAPAPQSAISAANLTTAAIAQVRSAAGWTPPGMDAAKIRPEDLAPAAENPNFSFIAWNFRQAATDIAALVEIPIPPPALPPPLDVESTAGAISASLAPWVTVAERVRGKMSLPPAVHMPAYDPLEQIMAYPRFDDPTYLYLKQIAQEDLVPNLSNIPDNSVTLLEINWPFVESFLVGLNHEMSRELLWRGYPTDQRGSYFRLFWDVGAIPGAIGADGKVKETFLDIEPIHGWKLKGALTPLGGNRPVGRPDVKNLVLIVRGDLLRRYPNTQVYAVKAVSNPQPRPALQFPSWSRRPDESNVQPPILFAKFDPDLYCFGFKLQKEEAIGALDDPANLGWYFALAERIGEPRFGLEPSPAPPFDQTAGNLNWGHIAANPDTLAVIDLSADNPPGVPLPPLTTDTAPARKAVWGNSGSAADMAAILLREPYRVYYHASKMIVPQP